MSRWKMVVPDGCDPLCLPEVWHLLHQPDEDSYVVVGRFEQEESPCVVIRVTYASGAGSVDLRRAVGSMLTIGIARAVRRRRSQI